MWDNKNCLRFQHSLALGLWSKNCPYIYILKKKKKKLFFSSSNLSPPSLPLYLPTTLYFTVKLHSSFPLYNILTLLLPILFCINLISLIPFNPYFFYTKIVSTLSLSLSLLIFVISYNSNLGWWFFFYLIFCVVFFKFLITNHSYSFGWILVWVNM